MLAEAFQTTLEDAVPLSEVEFVIVDLETTGGSPADCADHRDRRGQAPRRRAHRRVPDPREPRCADPAPDHAPHRDRRPRRGRRAADRVGPALVRRVRPRLRLRGAQRAVRLHVPERRARAPRLRRAPAATRLHRSARPPRRLARRPQRPAPHPRPVLPHGACDRRTARCPTPRPAPRSSTGSSSSVGGSGSPRSATCTARFALEGVRTSARSALPTTCRTHRVSTCSEGATAACSTWGSRSNLRSRVKSYFYGDERKKVEDLLAETVSVDGVSCGSELESLVLEARLIREHEPKYNRRGKTWRKYAYLRIDDAEAYPRIKVVRETKGGGAFLGPFPSSHLARLAKEALEDVFPIRRCTKAMRASTRFAPCALAEHAPMPGSLRRARRPRALRGARPLPDLLPLHTGRAPRNARGADARPRGTGTVRGGRVGARPAPRARRGAGSSQDRRLAARDRRARPARRRRSPSRAPARRPDPERRRSAAGRPVPARSGGRARRAACMGGSQRGPRRDRRRVASPNRWPAAPSCTGCFGRSEHAIARADYGRTTARLTVDGDRGHPRRRANAHRPLPRFVRRAADRRPGRARREGSDAPLERRARRRRADDLRPRPTGGERSEHGASGERSGRRARRGLRLQREHRVRLGHEGGAARRRSRSRSATRRWCSPAGWRT